MRTDGAIIAARNGIESFWRRNAKISIISVQVQTMRIEDEVVAGRDLQGGILGERFR
jgi:hypothetical protein